MEKFFKGAFRFVVGFGCLAFFLFWVVGKFTEIGGAGAAAIFFVALLGGIASAAYPDEEGEKP